MKRQISTLFLLAALAIQISTVHAEKNHVAKKSSDDETKDRVMVGLTYGKRNVKIKSRDFYYNDKQLNVGSENFGNLGLFLQANSNKVIIHVNAELFASSHAGWGVHLGGGYSLIHTKYFTIAPVFVIGGGFSDYSLGSFELDGFKTVGDHVFVGKGAITNTQNGYDYGSNISLKLRTSYFNMRPFLQAQAHVGRFTFHTDFGYNFALSNDAKVVWSGKGYTKEESDNGNLVKMLTLTAEGNEPKAVSEEIAQMGSIIKNKNGQGVSDNPISFRGILWNFGLAYSLATKKK